MIASLLKKRTFLPIFLTQFFGAFNDNAFKLAMLTLISYHLSASQDQSEQYQVMASALFIMPFFFLSAIAGQLADKFDKARMVRCIKTFEVFLMLIGGLGLYFGNIVLLMATLTGLGVHSTMFGPIKYAILPDHLPKSKLVGATALIESSTFLAILFGTIFGTLCIGGVGEGTRYAFLLTTLIAILGLLASCYIPPAPSKTMDLTVDWQVWRSTYRIMKEVHGMPKRRLVIYALSWYWLVGTVFLIKLPDYTNFVLHGDPSVFAVFLALFSIGVGSGSLTINRILRDGLSLRFVPYSMLLLSIFAVDLYIASPAVHDRAALYAVGSFFLYAQHVRLAADLFFIAFSGGLFAVPLYAYLQITSEASARARTIAANNIYNALFMVAGSLLVMCLLYFKLTITAVFLVIAILNALAALSCAILLKL